MHGIESVYINYLIELLLNSHIFVICKINCKIHFDGALIQWVEQKYNNMVRNYNHFYTQPA